MDLNFSPPDDLTQALGEPDTMLDRIVAAADAVVSRDGATKLTLRRVAAELSVSLGTVTYYFPTREALVSTLLQREEQRWTDAFARLGPPAKDGASPEAILAAAVRRGFRRGLRRAPVGRLSLMKSADAGADGEASPIASALAHYLAENLRGKLDVTRAQLCARLHSLGDLILRYAVRSPDALRRLFGAKTQHEAEDCAEAHLVEMAQLLFSAPAATRS